MPSFLASSKVGKGELRLYLTNQNGYPQDAFDVRWTIYAIDGAQISGARLCAIKANTGEYYAPWEVVNNTGNYYIKWEWVEEFGESEFTSENFFVVNLASYGPSCSISPDGYPAPGKFTYLSGSLLGPGDLPLYIKNDDGFPVDPFAIYWTIYNAAGGMISSKTPATRVAVGEYYASWLVSVFSGDYAITWEWLEQSDSPLVAKTMRFSVVNVCSPYAPPPCIYTYPCSCPREYFCNNILIPQMLTSCTACSCVTACGCNNTCGPAGPIIIA